MNCFRYLDFKSFDEVDRLTIPEYALLIEAAQLKQLDETHKIHSLAWLTFAAHATNRQGKPVFKKFKRFFDYKAELKKLTNKSTENGRFPGIGKVFKKGE